MKENVFGPEEWSELTSFIKGLGSHLPHDKANWIWNCYNRIQRTNERTPCTCSSSGQLWAKAVKTIEAYIKEMEEQPYGQKQNVE